LIVLPERTYANDCVVLEIPFDQQLKISHFEKTGQCSEF
jgi:hypothetical protein